MRLNIKGKKSIVKGHFVNASNEFFTLEFKNHLAAVEYGVLHGVKLLSVELAYIPE